MNRLQTYTAIFVFMNWFWQERKTEFDDDLPSILGGMGLRREDGFPWADSTRHEWFEYLPAEKDFSPEEGFAIMGRYLRDWIAIGEVEPRDISRMLQTIEAARDIFWNQWLQAVDVVLHEMK